MNFLYIDCAPSTKNSQTSSRLARTKESPRCNSEDSANFGVLFILVSCICPVVLQSLSQTISWSDAVNLASQEPHLFLLVHQSIQSTLRVFELTQETTGILQPFATAMVTKSSLCHGRRCPCLKTSARWARAQVHRDAGGDNGKPTHPTWHVAGHVQEAYWSSQLVEHALP